jgi:hypothetical protein
MKRNIIIATVLVAVLAATTVFGVAAYRTASASSAYGITPVLQNLTRDTVGPAQQGMDRGGPRGGQSDEQLAKALGITTDQLQAAYTKATQAALAQAVKDGLITQAQADEFTSNGNSFPMGGRILGGRMLGWLQQKGIDYDQYLADALSISVADLQAARLTARNAEIDAAVTNGDLTQDQADLMKARSALAGNQDFQDAMKTAYEAAVQQAVKDGVITQAQADLILKSSPNGFGPMGGPDGGPMGGPWGRPDGFGPGGRGGHGGPGGFGPQGPGSQQQPQTPSATPSGNGL